MASILDRFRLGLVAFKEAYLTSRVVNSVDWSAQEARMLRYDVLWAMYSQTSYRDIHSWATALRKQYSLYKYIRPIYNPAYRLGQFWQTHLFGGLLDAEAGPTGAIPIVTDSEKLRPAIAELWKWSKWNVRKDILTTRGTVLGDVAIKVVDDVARGRVYLDLLHPGILESVDRDPFGNVKGYTIKEKRANPAGQRGTVIYSERVTRSGPLVVYETFLNGDPYAWKGNEDQSGNAVSSWSEPYTFIPLVVIQHHDVGLDWGWSELHPIRAKVQEVDDIASMVSDGVRKMADPTLLLSGAKRPASGVLVLSGANAATASGGATDTDRPFPGREEIKTIYLGKDGQAKVLSPELNLEHVLLHIDSILREIERDVLELSSDIHTASGDASGRALRTARQPVVSKVLQRRANYDGAMVAAQQMAIAIGGFRGYNGYSGFSLDSYASGALDHSIGVRPVFEEDLLDKAEIAVSEWKAAKAAVDAGATLEGYLRDSGWSEDRIRDLKIAQNEVSDGPRT